MKILIIGFGVVGKNMADVFTDADIFDPLYPTISCNENKFHDLAFVCVPTDMKEDGSCDISIVKKVLLHHFNFVHTFCIRSTIPPGTTEKLKHELKFPNIVFSPEYFGATIHANNPNYEFVTLGGDSINTAYVAKAYIEIKHPEFVIHQTDSKSAELCKYMENSFLALKVIFCNEFYRIAKKAKVDYTELRELFLADPRMNRSHTFVYDDHPYYDSPCLNKDIPALIAYAEQIGYTPKLMKQVLDSNNDFKKGI